MKKLLIAVAVTLTSLSGVTGCAVTSGQETAGQYVDDATITTRVKSRFAQDPKVSAMRISVETLKGVVQLSGFATTEDEKVRAEQIARAVPDVRGVQNAIVVRAATS